MNIIFLDVDGVLNSLMHWRELYNLTGKPQSGTFYPEALKNLQYLVYQADAYIVISSRAWKIIERNLAKLMEELKKYELDIRVVGLTPNLGTIRGKEIGAFLNNFGECNFVILDDSCDMGEYMDHLVKTNAETGLTLEDVQKAIKKFEEFELIR